MYYSIVSLIEWFQGIPDDDNSVNIEKKRTSSSVPVHVVSPKNSQRLPLIDLRSDEAFIKRNLLTTSTFTASRAINNNRDDLGNPMIIVHLPFQSLQSGERSCELPPRNIPFAILIPKCERNDHEHDQNEHYENIINFFSATRSKATLQSRKPWLVKQIILENDSLWNDAKKLGILGESSQPKSYDEDTDNYHTVVVQQPLPRLWRPDPMIESILLPMLKSKLQAAFNRNKSTYNCSTITKSCQSPFIVCDLGSGAGRDVCFLAEELNFYLYQLLELEQQCSHECHVVSSKNMNLCIVGIDNHKGSGKRCVPFWKNHNVQHITKSLRLDLNKTTSFSDQLLTLIQDNNGTTTLTCNSDINHDENNGIVCLYAIRFLNRKLISYIANCHREQCRQDDDHDRVERIHEPLVLKRGTLFAMSHFCKAYNGAPWDFDHPKESSVLERNELHDLFNKNGLWEILHDEICFDGDHGRTLINFIAKRV